MKNLEKNLKDILNDHPYLQKDFFYGEGEDTIEGISVELVDYHGGEGEGENFYKVYKFTEGDSEVFVKFFGSYYSYEGADYDDYKFVIPVERTVIFYE